MTVCEGPRPRRPLLLFFSVQRVATQPRTVLLYFQLLAAGLPPQRVVVVACFLTHEVHNLEFFLALCHRLLAVPCPGRRESRSVPAASTARPQIRKNTPPAPLTPAAENPQFPARPVSPGGPVSPKPSATRPVGNNHRPHIRLSAEVANCMPPAVDFARAAGCGRLYRDDSAWIRVMIRGMSGLLDAGCGPWLVTGVLSSASSSGSVIHGKQHFFGSV